MSNNGFSRFLTSLLRHQAINKGYKMDDQGFVSVDEIISKCTTSLEQIKQIVETDNKNRFELKEINGAWYVRAVQGHSIQLANPVLELVTNPLDIPTVVHGTNKKAYKSIKIDGLNRMSRTHIHFASGTLDDKSVISGMRKTASVMIHIDVEKAMAAGITFYKSLNGVILSEGINGVIGPEYFSGVDFI